MIDIMSIFMTSVIDCCVSVCAQEKYPECALSYILVVNKEKGKKGKVRACQSNFWHIVPCILPPFLSLGLVQTCSRQLQNTCKCSSVG